MKLCHKWFYKKIEGRKKAHRIKEISDCKREKRREHGYGREQQRVTVEVFFHRRSILTPPITSSTIPLQTRFQPSPFHFSTFSSSQLTHSSFFVTGTNHFSMQLPRSLSGLTNLLFNRKNIDDNTNRKRLRPAIVSPRRKVPKDITKPPYVKSMVPPGIASGPEVHDEKGIQCMRASGRLAAQVLQYAGTLVKVRFYSSFSALFIS